MHTVITHLEDSDSLIEMVPFHRGRGIDRSQRGRTLDHVSIGLSTMVNVMAKTRNVQRHALAKTGHNEFIEHGDDVHDSLDWERIGVESV